MTDEQQEQANGRGSGPGLLPVLVLVGIGIAVWQGVFGGGLPSLPGGNPGPAAASVEVAAARPGPAGWVVPVDAPLWGGFRTPSNPDHQGVDLGAVRGSEIRAAASGTVVRVRCDVRPASHGCDRDGSPQIRGCGWYVDIRHDGDVYTRYCHMQSAPLVVVDQAVSVGQVLGYVGSSGNSSAPHLHFEVHLGGQTAASAVDPVTFMAEHGAPLH